jgi:hypothetical protein
LCPKTRALTSRRFAVVEGEHSIKPAAPVNRRGVLPSVPVPSRRTLQIMFWVTVILMPLIATYTTWAYAKMRGKIDPETIRAEY